jgi:hypothetical protein
MFGEVNPASRWVNGAVLSSRFNTGREREAGDGEAHQLALTAAEAADGIAHQKYLGEVISAQCGTPKSLAGTKLALDRNPVARVQSEIRGMSVRGMGVLFPSALTIELILEFHLQCLLFSGRGERSKSFSAVRRGGLELRGVRIG